jgi:choline/glycine/proline betaine transport protein
LNVAPGKLPWEMAEHDDLLRDQSGGDSEGKKGEDGGSVKPA